MCVDMESLRETEVILRAFHSVQLLIYFTFFGSTFLCRAPVLISITIPIYPQLASLSPSVSIRTGFFFFTFALIPLYLKSAVFLQSDSPFPAWVAAPRCLPASAPPHAPRTTASHPANLI